MNAPAHDAIADRCIALAGLLQALRQVRRIAETGQSESAALATAIDSVFRVDAESPAAVYGDVDAVRPGLLLLRNYFRNEHRDEAMSRLALAVLQIERRFVRDPAMAGRVRDGILAARDQARRLGAGPHPEVIAQLGALYADTISHLRPRVMVQGNPHYLGQAGVVSEIRTVLLAALRSAVLWRQMGGSLPDFLFRRRDMLAAATRLSA